MTGARPGSFRTGFEVVWAMNNYTRARDDMFMATDRRGPLGTSCDRMTSGGPVEHHRTSAREHPIQAFAEEEDQTSQAPRIGEASLQLAASSSLRCTKGPWQGLSDRGVTPELRETNEA